MSWLWLVFGLLPPIVTLPGLARPVLLVASADQLWVLRQPEGDFPSWWLANGQGVEQVVLPPETRFAAPLPNGMGLLAIFSDRVQRYAIVAGQLVEKGPVLPWKQPLLGSHPRLDMTFESMGSRFFLPLVGNRSLRVVEWAGELKVAGEIDLAYTAQTNPDSLGIQTFFVAKVVASEGSLTWMQGRQCLRWRPEASQIIRDDPPELRNMEQAAPLVVKGRLFWLIHGGVRGELSSFGWRLTDKKGGVLARGQGILTRWGLVLDRGSPRLIIWTVSQKVRSQIWSAMSGVRTFLGKVLVWETDTWKSLQEIQVKMGKGKGHKAFALLWQADLNHDDYCDLVVVDEKGDARFFPSHANGQFAVKPRNIGQTPDEALVANRQLYFATKEAGRWQLRKVVVP